MIIFKAKAFRINLMYCCMLAGCSTTTGPISGQVLAESTAAPISGAVVVAYWMGSDFGGVDSRTTCYHMASAVTDADGKFVIGNWKNEVSGNWGKGFWIGDRHILIGAYKKGMALDRQEVKSETQNTIKLHTYTYTPEDRLYYLSHISGYYCTQYDIDSKKTSILLKQEAYKEAVELKTSDPSQPGILKAMRDQIREMQDQP